MPRQPQSLKMVSGNYFEFNNFMNWLWTCIGLVGTIMLTQRRGRSHWSISVARLWSWLCCAGSMAYSLAAQFDGPPLIALLAAGVWMVAIPVMLTAIAMWVYSPLKNEDGSQNRFTPISAMLCVAGALPLAFRLFQGLL